MSLLEQLAGQVDCPHSDRRCVHENVEGAHRPSVLEAETVESSEHDRSAPPIDLQIILKEVHRTGESS